VEKKKTKTIKVVVTLTNEKRFWAEMYSLEEDRVQDVLNDERRFLPFYVLDHNKGSRETGIKSLLMIHKDSISHIEERNY